MLDHCRTERRTSANRAYPRAASGCRRVASRLPRSQLLGFQTNGTTARKEVLLKGAISRPRRTSRPNLVSLSRRSDGRGLECGVEAESRARSGLARYQSGLEPRRSPAATRPRDVNAPA